jgi:uncharacterized membrane protein HdeD (DUF308 family)
MWLQGWVPPKQGYTILQQKMDISPESVQPNRKYNQFAIASFVLGLLAMIFPVISLLYLVARNGGPGYLQSLICGIPVAFASILTGIVSQVQIRRRNPPGTGKAAWMAIFGIVLGILSFGIDCVMVAVLILPFILGNAH